MSLFDYVIAACGASIFYGTLWLISKGRWIGLGDVKLAFPLGLAIGTYGVFSFVVLSFWVGALVSLVLLGTQKILKRGKHDLPFFNVPLTMKSEVPFAPFMIIAFLLVYFSHADIVSLLTYGF